MVSSSIHVAFLLSAKIFPLHQWAFSFFHPHSHPELAVARSSVSENKRHFWASQHSVCLYAQAVPPPQRRQSRPLVLPSERRSVCWDEASASSLRPSALLLTAHPTLFCSQCGGRGCMGTAAVLGKGRAGAWSLARFPLLFPVQLGILTAVTGTQYLPSAQTEGTRAKRSRAQPRTFISKVEVLPEQLRCMVFGTGAKPNSSFTPHPWGSNIQVFCWKSLNQALSSHFSPYCCSPTGAAKSRLILYPSPHLVTT